MKKYTILFLSLLFFVNLSGQKDSKDEKDEETPLICDVLNRIVTDENQTFLEEIAYDFKDRSYVYFDAELLDESKGTDEIIRLYDIDENTSFDYVSESESRFNEEKVFIRYQQYYKSVKVNGGGFTEALIIGGGGPVGPHNPCAQAYMINPYIYTDINLDVIPDIEVLELIDILGTSQIQERELLVMHNLEDDCTYQLCFKVNYFDKTNKVSWIDANSGEILRTIDADPHKSAPTEDYDIQDMDDTNSAGLTSLISEDGAIKTYNFAGIDIEDIEVGQYDQALIPNSPSNIPWSTTHASESVYQAHWMTGLAKTAYQTLGIEFPTINVAANLSGKNAKALGASNDENAYIAFGENNGNSLATYDIVAHELGHIFLQNFINYTNVENAAVHEGLSDIFGFYIEFLINGELDHTIGEDGLGDDARNISVMSGGFNACFILPHMNDYHEKGRVISSWFYQMTQWSNIDLELTMNVVLDAIQLMGPESTWEDFAEITTQIILEEYGKCSDEFRAAVLEWEGNCYETGYLNENNDLTSCEFDLTGPTSVCEEYNYAQFCVENGDPTLGENNYSWRIIGNQSTQFTSTLGMTGNGQQGGFCLTLIQFPTFTYYPRTVRIQVRSAYSGETITRTLKIRDCDGDDPTCKEYYDNLHSEEEELELREAKADVLIPENATMRLYNIVGQLLYEGSILDYRKEMINYNGVIFKIYFDEFGEIIQTKKEISIGL